LKISISQLTTYPATLEADLEAYAAAGFRAVELSLEKAERFLVGRSLDGLAELLDQHKLTASGAIGLAPSGPALLLSSGQSRDNYLRSLRSQLELCSVLGIGVLGIGADASRWATPEPWHTAAIRNLSAAADMAAEHNVRLAIEFMSLDAPIGPFVLDSLGATLNLIEAADDPRLGLSIDFFHHYRARGTALELASLSAAQIANVHVTDVKAGSPASLGDGDRVLPGEGAAPIAAYRDAIVATGYDGYWTLELLNADLWRLDVAEAAALSATAMQHFIEIGGCDRA
jgi:sugar phosphate isomerase/epimerase